jgi:hypothetical protein
MELKSVANVLAYTSIGCALSFWLGLILSRVPGVAGSISFVPPLWWLVIEGASVVLASFAAIARSKLWPLAVALAVRNFFFVMYVISS